MLQQGQLHFFTVNQVAIAPRKDKTESDPYSNHPKSLRESPEIVVNQTKELHWKGISIKSI